MSIDEPNHSDERLMEMPVSIGVDLAEKATFEWAKKDAVREAFEKSEVYRQWAIGGMPKDKQRLAFGVFEARQAEVDELNEQLVHYKSLTDRLDQYLCARNADVGGLYDIVAEKQKRIEELLMLTKFVKDHFEMNDLNKAMPRVYEEICEALGGGV